METLLQCQKAETSDADGIPWIMTPSSGRYNSAKLNLQHTMVDLSEQPVPYAHIIFVREDEFDLYCAKWKHSHAILTLPSQLEDCDETVDSGGIGFARRFIQIFCQKLGIRNYLQNDDNIRGYLTYKVDDKNYLVRNKANNTLQTVEITLFEIFTTFIDQSKCDTLNYEFSDEFEPYKGQQKSKLAAYTGPWRTFGLLGMKKYRHLNYLKSKNPFSRGHVTSSVFFNGEQLEKENVKFPAWPYREDLQFNCEAAAKGLEVLKFNKYLVVKEKSPPMPCMIVWDETTTLVSSQDGSPLKEDDESFQLSLKWIRLLKPVEFNLINVSSKENNIQPLRNIQTLKQRIVKYHLAGTYLIGIGESVLSNSLKDSLENCLMQTWGSSESRKRFGIIGELKN